MDIIKKILLIIVLSFVLVLLQSGSSIASEIINNVNDANITPTPSKEYFVIIK